MPLAWITASNTAASKLMTTLPTTVLCLSLLRFISYAHADDMSALIAQKSAQADLPVPAARVTTRTSIQRKVPSASVPAYDSAINTMNTSPVISYRYQPPAVRPATVTTSTNIRPTYNNNNNAINTNPVIRYRYQQPAVSPATVTTSTSIRPTYSTPANNTTFATNNNYRYPKVPAPSPSVLPAFLSGSYDNVDSEYLPLLSAAESQSSMAARGVISTARAMALNERTIIQGGCWDYLDAVFKRAGVSRDTLHKGTYGQGPYANSSEIEIGDWLYYINHGYNGVEHSGLFVGWVDKPAKQALILSYAGQNRREPARYRVYDLSNVYQIMRPTI